MIVAARSARPSPDAVIGPALVVVLGCATVAAAGAAAAQQQTIAMMAAGLAGATLLVVLAAGWVDPLMVLVITLPLPALYAAGDVRLSPAVPVTAVVLAAWFLAWAPGGRRLSTGTLPVLSLMAFLMAYLLAGAVSAHRGAALREIVNLMLIGGLLVAATDTFVRRPRSGELVAQTITIVASIVGFLAALETLGIIPGSFSENGINRAALGFGQPNPLGMYLALSLPFVVHVRRHSGPGVARAMATAALCTTVVGLVCTFSRGSWVSVLAGTGVLLFLGERRFVLRVIGAAFVAALVVDIGTGGAVQQRITGTFTDWAVTQRAALMLAGIQLFLEHPILGAGPGAFAVELDRLGALVPTLWDLQSTPHNAYIQVAAESGLVGLTIWIGLLAGLIRRGVRAVSHSTDVGAQTGLRRAALWTLAIFCVLGMFVWPLSHGHAQLAVIAAAIVCSAPLRHPSRAPAHGNGKPAAIARARITGGAA